MIDKYIFRGDFNVLELMVREWERISNRPYNFRYEIMFAKFVAGALVSSYETISCKIAPRGLN